MPRLTVKLTGDGDRLVELLQGFNTIGRGSSNDFPVDHPSVSEHHCVISVANGSVTVRDLNSTNGTFIDDRPIREDSLNEGQTLRLGEVELVWERGEIVITVPRPRPPPKPPESVPLHDGVLSCLHHHDRPAIRHCTRCHSYYCGQCVHPLKRVGGATHHLCPVCSGECERIGPRREERTLLGQIRNAIGRLLRP